MEGIYKLIEYRESLIRSLIDLDLEMTRTLGSQQNIIQETEIDFYLDEDTRKEMTAAKLLQKLKV